MKYLLIIFLVFLNINPLKADKNNEAYFAGGCFWCVEESFENLNGVSEVISGYSGGTTKNPTYKEVTYGNTGHFEVVKIIYDKEIISYEELLKNFWFNIDPFDPYGQFCDKGYSYRSVAFYETEKEKKLIERDIKDLEKRYTDKGTNIDSDVDCSLSSSTGSCQYRADYGFNLDLSILQEARRLKSQGIRTFNYRIKTNGYGDIDRVFNVEELLGLEERINSTLKKL